MLEPFTLQYKVCNQIVGTSNPTNNFNNWIKSGIVSSGSQLQITQIFISCFNIKVEMQKL